MGASTMRMRAKGTILVAVVSVGFVVIAAVGITTTVAAVNGMETMIADAVVTYDRLPPGEQIRRNHGSQYRIDARVRQGNTNEFLNLQIFNRPAQRSSFKIYRHDDGSLAGLSVQQDELSAIPQPLTANFTGGAETHLGEKCRIWRISHKTNDGNDFVQSGCLTPDGISLWSRQANIDAVFARKIYRQPVSPADVRVPAEFLDIRSWAKNIGRQSHAKDFEVIFGPSASNFRYKRAPAERHVERRSGSWTYSADGTDDKPRYISVLNPDEGLSLIYSMSGGGVMTINRQSPKRSTSNDIGGKVRDARRADEIILGEKCQWWNMMPGMNDGGQFNCITEDGITLKIDRMSYNTVVTREAITLRRSPQPLTAVLPGKQITSPAAWGF